MVPGPEKLPQIPNDISKSQKWKMIVLMSRKHESNIFALIIQGAPMSFGKIAVISA